MRTNINDILMPFQSILSFTLCWRKKKCTMNPSDQDQKASNSQVLYVQFAMCTKFLSAWKESLLPEQTSLIFLASSSLELFKQQYNILKIL